jgi:aspartyl-tRNA(Asn)/glutamyl-tRNA(Gln) amidotransferase subunit A
VNDENAISGGSSSGAAASVAYGLAAAGIGSDTGGSVRIPAAWNDLVGLKTTSGRVSLKGVVPLCARFDTVGPLCKTVADTAAVFAALEGRAAADLKGVDLCGKRFAVLQTVAMDDVEEGPLKGFEDAISDIKAAGAAIENIDVPQVNDAMALAGILFTAEAYGTWKDVIEANPEKMFVGVLERFRGGQNALATDYITGWQTLEKLREVYLTATAGYDGILLPTSPIMPPNLEKLATDHDYFAGRNLLALRNTRIGNLMGLSALTLPTSVPSAGIMIMTPAMDEDRLLRIGAAIEAVLA